MSTRLAAAVLALAAAPVFAQTAPPLVAPVIPQNACFEVIALPHDPSLPAVAVLVDKCSGKTWSLARTVNGVMWFPIPEFKPEKRAEQ